MDNQNLRIGIIDESQILEFCQNLYAAMESAYMTLNRNAVNFSVTLVPIDGSEFKRNGIEFNWDWDADTFFYPSALSLSSPERTVNHTILSTVFSSMSMYIVSPSPQAETVTSMDIINMDSESYACVTSSLFIICFIMSLSNYVHQENVTNFGIDLLENLWRSVCLFFYEPYVRTYSQLSWRITTAVLFLAVTLIYFDVSSCLKSKFSTINFDLVDSVEDLLRQSHEEIIVPKALMEETFVNIMAKENDNYKTIKQIWHQPEMEEIMTDTFLDEASFGSKIYFILFHLYLWLSVLFKISEDPSSLGQLYLSQPLQTTYGVYPISRNCSKAKILAINKFLITVFEGQLTRTFQHKMEYYWDRIKWTKPLQVESAITFTDVRSLTTLYGLALLASCPVLLLQRLLHRRKVKNGKLRRKRKQQIFGLRGSLTTKLT